MPKLTVVFGLVLCAISVLIAVYLLGFGGGEIKSPTIFIPCAIGIPLILLGILAMIRPGLRKHVMHAAVTVGLLGALAALGRGIPQLIRVFRGETVDWLPVSTVWAMAIVCVTFVLVCVESFIAAGKARRASEEMAAKNP
ncbi:MAG: hypothetical protein WCI02_08180 [Planctomycetota bacterium]